MVLGVHQVYLRSDYRRQQERCFKSKTYAFCSGDRKQDRWYAEVRDNLPASTSSVEKVIRRFEPYCAVFLATYVDKEGMLQGTDLDWFPRLRAGTTHELTAALGMAIYTGRLSLEELARLAQ